MSFFSYLKRRRGMIALFLLFFMIELAVFQLYHLPALAVLYPTALCCMIGVGVLLRDYRRVNHMHKRLLSIQSMTDVIAAELPETIGILDAEYKRILQMLCDEQHTLTEKMDHRYQNMVEYYTVWAHQIKTPIASMHLTLQNTDQPYTRRLSAELTRIEQYVEMVLVFLRLDSDSTDYVIQPCDLDSILRPVIRKFAGDFIAKKLCLDYDPVNLSVTTDEKWISFVLEQILSNALKYTPSGGIRIDMERPKTLCIRDTGIGIAPEDLPRIFEKGYTGYNGRSDKRASGIGLYLCKRICRNLGHTISVESIPDIGTTVRINLEQNPLEIE